ncbi:hypothetical protein HK104_002687 [Borealophlyctis nickersoniae]|nr:hypothetical protein HK104_002687 [Borealophlyctis nickersoniae]
MCALEHPKLVKTGDNSPDIKPDINPNRVYIGNLDPSVTEYNILKLFGKFGEITKIDYLWHKHGPKKGEPRGYCFLEFADRKACTSAISELHKRVVAGRPLVVTISFDRKLEEPQSSLRGATLSSLASSATKARSGSSKRDFRRDLMQQQEAVNLKVQPKIMNNVGINAKISALERKLNDLQRGGSSRSGIDGRKDGVGGKGRADHRNHPYRRK